MQIKLKPIPILRLNNCHKDIYNTGTILDLCHFAMKDHTYQRDEIKVLNQELKSKFDEKLMHFHRMQPSALFNVFWPMKFSIALELPEPDASLLIIMFP